MSGSNVKSRKKAKQDAKPKPRRIGVTRMPSEWKVGDEIVTSTDKDGFVNSTVKITHLETGGCRNLHVNRTACYDRAIPYQIAVLEAEALAVVAGLDWADMLVLANPESLEEMVS